MRIVGLATVCGVVTAIAVGCGPVVDGLAKPAPNLKPRPLSAETIKQLPLDGSALSRMLGQNLVQHDPPESGGADRLPDARVIVSPPACLGITMPLQKTDYESAEVKGFTSQSWFTDGSPGKVMLVIEGVVAASTATQATSLFDKFAKQWQECQGKNALGLRGKVLTWTAVGDVHVSENVAYATSNVAVSVPDVPSSVPTVRSRAIGVEMNCLVDVEVAFFTGPHASDPGPADAETSGAELVRAIQHKISNLSRPDEGKK